MDEEIKNITPVSQGMISAQNIVNRSNSLLASIEAPLSVGAFKLFDTYLSLINPKDSSKTEVVIRKADYIRLLNLKQIRTEVLNKVTNELLSLKFGIGEKDTKARTSLNLFDIAGTFADRTTGEIKIYLKCSESAKPLLFNIQTVGYIKYQLRNTLALNTDYEIRLYIYFLSQIYRKNWEVSFRDLKKKLFCEKVKQYQTFAEFNRKIFKKAIADINQKTNVTMKYQYIFQRGKGAGSGKIKFTVIECNNMVFSDSLQDGVQTTLADTDVLSDINVACGNCLKDGQAQCLYDAAAAIDRDYLKQITGCEDRTQAIVKVIQNKYHLAEMYGADNPYSYVTTLLKEEQGREKTTHSQPNKTELQTKASYDIDELEKRDTFSDLNSFL